MIPSLSEYRLRRLHQRFYTSLQYDKSAKMYYLFLYLGTGLSVFASRSADVDDLIDCAYFSMKG